MKIDNLKEFARLRKNLIEERESIESRLNQINGALGELQGAAAVSGTPAPASASKGGRRGGRRQLSAEARARIAEAQKARWASARKKSGNGAAGGGAKTAGRRKMSPAARKRIADAAKQRWAAAKAAGRNAL
jgi:hypothetical protein